MTQVKIEIVPFTTRVENMLLSINTKMRDGSAILSDPEIGFINTHLDACVANAHGWLLGARQHTVGALD